MTSLNLATIFGPNLLHKLKNSDKEFSVQSSARAEESTAVIGVLQKMITSYQSLFMVPPDLQNEVLMSLLDTDPDVVDYLLRRKASQSSDLLPSEDAFSLSERRSSSDSNKASSGEVSPYDNNSPVLSERREGSSPGSETLIRIPEQGGLTGHSRGRDTETISEEHANIWGTWHSTLKPAHRDESFTGSHGNMSEGSSRSSQEGLDGLHGDSRQPPASAPRGHPPVSRVCRPRLSVNISPAPKLQRGSHVSDGESPPPPYSAHHRLATSLSTPQLAPPTTSSTSSSSPPPPLSQSRAELAPQSPEWQEWQRDRWQIWQLLSSDNADTLPETLV
uniref:Rho-GAP domain-containing protein n=1 Tax=Knipowitschia caucasica TaxID=637954 RepID=A0AAV2LGG4_KNICA